MYLVTLEKIEKQTVFVDETLVSSPEEAAELVKKGAYEKEFKVDTTDVSYQAYPAKNFLKRECNGIISEEEAEQFRLPNSSYFGRLYLLIKPAILIAAVVNPGGNSYSVIVEGQDFCIVVKELPKFCGRNLEFAIRYVFENILSCGNLYTDPFDFNNCIHLSMKEFSKLKEALGYESNTRMHKKWNHESYQHIIKQIFVDGKIEDFEISFERTLFTKTRKK